jgi:hypothetical protein
MPVLDLECALDTLLGLERSPRTQAAIKRRMALVPLRVRQWWALWAFERIAYLPCLAMPPEYRKAKDLAASITRLLDGCWLHLRGKDTRNCVDDDGYATNPLMAEEDLRDRAVELRERGNYIWALSNSLALGEWQERVVPLVDAITTTAWNAVVPHVRLIWGCARVATLWEGRRIRDYTSFIEELEQFLAAWWTDCKRRMAFARIESVKFASVYGGE